MDVADTLHWKAQYEIGHERIDFEHKVFLTIIRSIDAEVRGNADRARILRLLRELTAYARFHFISEENVMIDCGYPEYEDHAALHVQLVETLHVRSLRFEAGQGTATALVAFLVEWFVGHTTVEDVKIARFLAG